MKLFNWIFKKKVSEAVEVEEVTFEGIGKWLGVRDKDLGGYEKEALDNIGKRFEGFYVSLEEKLEVLKGVDIESKNEHGRAKVLVRQGLDKYVNFVHILLKDLRDVDFVDLNKVIRDIGERFTGFEINSARSYERATYLVGDEIMIVRNEIRGFYNGLVEIFEKDKISIRDLGRIRNALLKLREFENGEKIVDVIEREIEMKDLEIEKVGEKIVKMKSEVEKMRLSSKYIANVKRGEDIKILKKEIEKEIGLLKGLIDFKKIIGIVHGNEREFYLIKEYRDHFAIEFSRDGGKKLLKLLEDLNMKSSAVRGKFDLIKGKEIVLKKNIDEVGLDIVAVKLEEITGIESGVDGMKTDKVKIERRASEADFRLKGLRNETIKLVEEIGEVKVV